MTMAKHESQAGPSSGFNHPVEEHDAIVAASHHILFETEQSKRRKGKYKHDQVELHDTIKEIPTRTGGAIRTLSVDPGFGPRCKHD